MKISEIQCDACRADATLASDDQKATFIKELADWDIIKQENTEKLRRIFSFPDFVSALAFTNKVGALAEEYNHHPDILTEWGKTTVTWWSHKIKGLHQLDFALAKKTQELL